MCTSYHVDMSFCLLTRSYISSQMTLRITALSLRAPSPGSASPRVAVEAPGAPGAAATATCSAMMTQSAMTTAPSATTSTILIQAP